MSIPFTVQGTFDAMKGQLDEAGVAVPMFLGARHLFELASPPRIVWVPTQDVIGPPLRVTTNPQQLFNSDLGVDIHCWGNTFDDAIALRDAFIRVARLLDGVSFKVNGGGFLNPGEDAWIKHGEVYVLACSFPLPIFATPPQPTATPTKIHGEGCIES